MKSQAAQEVRPDADPGRPTGALTVVGAEGLEPARLSPQLQLTPEQVELLKRTVAKDSTDDELAIFLHIARRTGLDPFTKQIHAVKRWSAEAGRSEMSIQTGIDGLRLIAERTGKYQGQTAPFFLDQKGVWNEFVWTHDTPPVAARVGVYKAGAREVLWGVARWDAYKQTRRDGALTSFWKRMGPEMLAKCAEALALRKAFPHELSGLYSWEEMQQADSVAVEETTHTTEASPADFPVDAAARLEKADEDKRMPFGRNKGKRLGELPDKDLTDLIEWCERKDADGFADLIGTCTRVLERRRGEKALTQLTEEGDEIFPSSLNPESDAVASQAPRRSRRGSREEKSYAVQDDEIPF